MPEEMKLDWNGSAH